jgi:methyl-accepting chemotaxis protein-like sensor
MAAQERILLENLTRSLLVRLLALFAAFVVVLIVLVVVLTVRALHIQEDLQLSKVDEVGRSTARFVSRIINPYLQFEQLDDVKKVVTQTRSGTTNCVYAAVVARDGTVIIAEPPSYAPSPQTTGASFGETTSSMGAPVRHFSELIGVEQGENARYLHLGIDLRPSQAELDQLRSAGLWLTTIALLLSVVLVGAGVAWIFARAKDVNSVTNRMRDSDDVISATTQELKASAAEILAVAKHTELNAADEAAAVDETRRTMHALLDASNGIAEGAKSVAEIAEQSASASGVIAERIAMLRTQALKITDVSETIQAIADKSDILALNASLEGARAGETGRGFVLVGAEMRRLAETVSTAVREIKQLASEIRELSQAAVFATEEGEKLSKETTETAKRIMLITAQQRTGTEQVSQSMDEIQKFTAQALSGAKQAQTTADNLANTAAELSNILEGSLRAHGAKHRPARRSNGEHASMDGINLS